MRDRYFEVALLVLLYWFDCALGASFLQKYHSGTDQRFPWDFWWRLG